MDRGRPGDPPTRAARFEMDPIWAQIGSKQRLDGAGRYSPRGQGRRVVFRPVFA